MKTNLSKILLIGATAASFSLGLTAPEARAQATVQTTTTTQNLGTISEFGPDTIVIRSESDPAPIRYSYSKTTTYVDETGAPVSIETVKSGLPVTVYYSRVGDTLVANRVVVRRAAAVVPVVPVAPAPAPTVIEKKTTTTTTTREKDKD